MRTVTNRLFRAHMAQYLSTDEALLLGDQIHHHALVIPLPNKSPTWSPSWKKTLRIAQDQFRLAYRELLSLAGR
jgi:hypothetical protein